MENQIVETLATLLKELQKYGTTESVIGKEIHIGEITIVPITKMSLGVGAGGGTKDKKEGEGRGGGGGGGLKVEPIGFLVIHQEIRLLQTLFVKPSIQLHGDLENELPLHRFRIRL